MLPSSFLRPYEAKRFKDAVDDAVVRITDESRDVVENIVAKFQARITNS